MNNEKYLPIGTVVLLKGGKKRIMITGFCTYADKDKSKLYDYTGCLYPEGFIKANETLLFDHDQIEKIYHMGLIDDEEMEFKKVLSGIVKQLEQNK